LRSIFKFRLRPFRLSYVEASRIRGSFGGVLAE